MCLQWEERERPCFDVRVPFQIMTSFRPCWSAKEQQDLKMREMLGFINIAKVASWYFWMTAGPRLKSLYLPKLKTPICLIRRFTLANSWAAVWHFCPLLDLHQYHKCLQSDINNVIMNMPPEGWGGNYRNKRWFLLVKQVSSLTAMIDCLIHVPKYSAAITRSILPLIRSVN